MYIQLVIVISALGRLGQEDHFEASGLYIKTLPVSNKTKSIL